jgi:protocatechuate 3,4-dioxygenase beta subunit
MAACAFLLVGANTHAQRSCEQKVATSWEITIAGPDEPGDRLVVEGIVTGSNGKPVEGAIVYVYHTDASGYYAPDHTSARLCGLMRTGADGRYRFRTIKPASYPDSHIPAHVHYVVSGAHVSEQQFLLEFEGDSHLSKAAIDRDRAEHEGFDATYHGIRPLEKRDGVWYCRRDFRVATH